jgi:hypothetical protein
LAGVPGAEVGPLPSAATRAIKAMSGRIKGCRSAGSMRSRPTATSCTRGSLLRIDSSKVGPRWRGKGERARRRPGHCTTLAGATILAWDEVSCQGHDVDRAKKRRRNHVWPTGDTPSLAPSRSQSPGVLAHGFSRRSVIDAHPLHGMGNVSEPLRRQP